MRRFSLNQFELFLVQPAVSGTNCLSVHKLDLCWMNSQASMGIVVNGNSDNGNRNYGDHD